MIRLVRQGQQANPTQPGCDQSRRILPREIGWGGYWDYYYSGALCFAPRGSRQK